MLRKLLLATVFSAVAFPAPGQDATSIQSANPGFTLQRRAAEADQAIQADRATSANQADRATLADDATRSQHSITSDVSTVANGLDPSFNTACPSGQFATGIVGNNVQCANPPANSGGGSGGLTNTRVFNASATWAVPLNVSVVRVHIWGAGGSPTAVRLNAYTQGGYGGGYCRKDVTVTTGTNLTITVGTSAGAGSTVQINGVTVCSATGGSSSPGTGSGGDLNFSGGAPGWNSWGNAGGGAAGESGNGNAAGTVGAGSGGAVNGNGPSPFEGGAGGITYLGSDSGDPDYMCVRPDAVVASATAPGGGGAWVGWCSGTAAGAAAGRVTVQY